MTKKYYVVADNYCPGAEFEDYEEARKYCVSLQKKGNTEARIILPTAGWDVYDPGPGPFDDDYYN